ncbi:four helix bundle protein [Brevundimonas sp.]|jgi:four helix bundle protein|uniref:four helix bundle protein n=1 Tax=Brevundimonas sp. TaxID=1871086 RepID=UPI00120933CA|nr:four helix bundle protein [Brevundimonas sp.]TAJ65266.1 MAG: four helix bundle protein [Brevundimonas sp.]
MTTGITGYRKLEVWQFAMDWIELVYRSSAGWPKDERFGLTSQVRRASVSVASNIAEGAARSTTGEFLQFVGIARGSLAEAETQLMIAARLGYLEPAAESRLMTAADRISRMLVSLAAALRDRKSR